MTEEGKEGYLYTFQRGGSRASRAREAKSFSTVLSFHCPEWRGDTHA